MSERNCKTCNGSRKVADRCCCAYTEPHLKDCYGPCPECVGGKQASESVFVLERYEKRLNQMEEHIAALFEWAAQMGPPYVAQRTVSVEDVEEALESRRADNDG